MFKLNKFKIAIFLLIIILFSTFCGCGSLDQTSDSSAQSKTATAVAAKVENKMASEVNISLYPGYMELAKGSKVKLAAKLTEEGTNTSLQWVSENPEVASVSIDGTVTANEEGDTLIDVGLKGSTAKKASCAVRVKKDGSTLLYTRVPQKPSETENPADKTMDNGTKDEQKENGDGEVPTEYDKSPDTPVEVIPSLDEFVWTIRIDDTCEKSLNTELGNIKASYRLKLTAVKMGGKTADGQYKCTATQEVKIDSSDMDEKLAGEIGGAMKSDNSVKSELKDWTFDIVRYNSSDYSSYGVKKGELPTLVPLIPLVKMAMGNIAFSTDASFGRTVTNTEGSGTGKGSVIKQNHAVPFKIGVEKDGNVELYVMDSGSMGSLQFKGHITKKPIRP